jgi:TldD protein
MARLSRPLATERVELAPEPAYPDVTYVSSYQVDPSTVPEADRTDLLAAWSSRLLTAPSVDHVDAMVFAMQEHTFYADLAGTSTTQKRVRIEPELTVVGLGGDGGGFETMRTLAPPTGRGWEYVAGPTDGSAPVWDWERELAELPDLLAERLVAPSVEAGRYDLVVDPTNLWLTIHESIGHATELDRALGYEANYAGTSFATFDRLGSLQYGSSLMHVTGDRTVEHGLATVGWDDEGVAGQQFDLVRDGVLVGYQLDRAMAQLKGLGRSNGCAYGDSALHVPIQRMANVSLQPVADGPDLDGLIGGVEDGLYVVGDKSWSIDMQRYNFQFTGQRFYRIRSGRLAGQVKDAAYQANTTEFWGSMSAVGGPSTYHEGGAFNCGKGQPGQTAAVTHGCPVARFDQVNILNTLQEAGR